MSTHRAITSCRICGGSTLRRVLDLGSQMLTGVFPREQHAPVTVGPLSLVKCTGGGERCGLLQLEHSYEPGELYGSTYGYRSGLNPTMVSHLHGKVRRIAGRVRLGDGDLVVDIGSNDGTTLAAYPRQGPTLVGIDPTIATFREFYRDDVVAIPDFFSVELLRARFPGRKAKVITSFAMFYDLESPVAFMRDIHESLADDGIWVFEQSYMPAMLETNSYDTVCHEHLEFYGLSQIQWMAERVGFKIVDVEFNDVNGGSFSVTVAKSDALHPPAPVVEKALQAERESGLETLAPYEAFAERTRRSRDELRALLARARSEGRRVAALGASTKGNVVLQYCGLTREDIECVGEVNPRKVGCFTPGSWIPIVSQSELLESNPDYLLVLPWHFRRFFLEHPAFRGRTLVFPLPTLDVVRPS